MRASAELPQIHIPVHGFLADPQLIHPRRKPLVPVLSLAAAHQLAGAGHQQIHRRHGLPVVVLVHVEGLDLLRPVIDEHRAVEIFLGQILFVLLGRILAVLRLELELVSVFHGLPQDRDGLLMGHPGAGAFRQRGQLVDQPAAGELVQEFQLIRAFLEHGPDDILQEILLDIHQLVEVAEGDFRLNHPEFRRVGFRVAVLRPEGRPEGIDLPERHGEGLALQLSADRQRGLLPEEILAEVRLLAQGQGRHGEGVPGALRIIGGDQGRMDVHISPVLEIGVDRHGRHAADAEHRLEQPRSRPQVGDLPQEFEGVLLGLQRIILRAVPFQLDSQRLDLRRLRIPVAGHHLPGHAHGAADVEALDLLEIRDIVIVDHLGILKAGSVEKVDEPHVLLLPVVADPSLQGNLLPLQLRQPLLQLPGGDDVHGQSPPISFVCAESYHIQAFCASVRHPPPAVPENPESRRPHNPCPGFIPLPADTASDRPFPARPSGMRRTGCRCPSPVYR